MRKIKNTDYDVIVIGGGITGTGTARDCSLRGLKVLLIERNDIANGATGRNHGLLHSGARYAMTDRESASECIKENLIIRKIARNCVEPSGGLFITLPEDSLEYQDKFIKSCNAAGIDAKAIDPAEALRIEPSANPELIGAVKVPDGSVDPFRLCSANMMDAKLHGTDVLLYTEVTEIVRNGDSVIGVRVLDKKSGETGEYHAPVTVNAGGIWGQRIAEMAGAKISMFPAKGSLLVFSHRVNNTVINRCRKPANADILVPGESVCVLGTTSDRVPFDQCDKLAVTADEVKLLLEEGAKLAPALANTRVLRAYTGVRPLVASDDDPSGRSISRGIVLLDHETRDGIRGFITISGGKLTTYRLMAEMASDCVCRKLGNTSRCKTATALLPGSEDEMVDKAARRLIKGHKVFLTMGQKAAAARHGRRAEVISFSKEEDKKLICGCENVTYGEIKYAVKELGVESLCDLRRRTRVGMGTCQGTYCTFRAAKALAEALGKPEKADELAKEYINERWKGMMPVGWGDALREMELMQRAYKFSKPLTFDK